MKYSYFPGCSAATTGMSYTMSTDYVASTIGFQMIEIPEWSCCGTSAARLTSYDLGYALPARSLALSEKMDASLDVVAPCAGCYQSLKDTVHYARTSDENLKHVQDMIQMPYEAKADVVSLLEAFAADDVKDAIKESVTKPLDCLKVASYYGCALVRPVEVCKFDDPENPKSMDEIMELIGAEPVDWSYKTECCGAAQQMTVPQTAKPLIERIFQNAQDNGADCIATACPLCQLNLDMREAEINKKRVAEGKEPFDIPCYYFTELVGRAEGGTMTELGIDIHFHPATGLLERKAKEAVEKAAAEKAAAEQAAKDAAEKAERIAKKQAEVAARKKAEAAAAGDGAEAAEKAADSAVEGTAEKKEVQQ